MAESFNFMFGMFEIILMLPTALMLEMVWVPKVQVKSPGVTDASKNYVAVHTGQLVAVNVFGITINNKFPGWVLCWVLRTLQLF